MRYKKEGGDKDMKYKKLDRRITKTALQVIEALCADYPRRKRILKSMTGLRDDSALVEFKRTNDIIDAAMECVDEGLRAYILMDIGNGNGYNRSMASPFLSKNSYYRQKNNAIIAMANKFKMVL